ncbi:MAG: hypothetical protein WCO77_09795 [bacterium]
MNKNTVKRWIGALAMSVIVSVIPGGCDSGTGDQSELDNYFANHPMVNDPRDGGSSIVSLTPAEAVVNIVGGRAVFAFRGGVAPYTWDVSDHSVGSISGSGEQGVYTATTVGNNNVIAYDRNGNAAIAKISGSSGGSTGGDLAVSASATSLDSTGSMSVLNATGGVAPYTWTVATGSKGGFVDGDTGATVIYVRDAAGDNAVTVTDSVGTKASVVINQP